MDSRALKALLAALTASNVKRYEFSPDGRLVIEFGDTTPQVPGADVEDAGELELPAGTPDPRAAIAKIYERATKRKVAA
jgi:hypothetical protein